MLHILKYITLLLFQGHFHPVAAVPRHSFLTVLEDANYLTIVGRRKLEKVEAANAISRRSTSSPHNDISEAAIEESYSQKSNFWPPWPFNLLRSGNKSQKVEIGDVPATSSYPSAASLFLEYSKQRTRIGVRQLKEIAATMYFHLPPALPPFIVLASLPRKAVVDSVKDTKTISRRFVPLFSLPFARSLAFGGLALTMLSWADMEIHRKRRLTPLLEHHSVSKASVVLPPFLPEAVPEPELEALESVENAAKRNETKPINVDRAHANLLSPKLRQHLGDLYEIAPRPRNFQSFVADWKQARVARKREVAKIRRQTVFDELVALQAIKRESKRFQRQKRSGTVTENGPEGLGYALVTGASQGIGRAIAVELARWEIPLILVARDVDKLTALAYDLEACYGVRCCVLQADLSKADAAEKVYRTTSDNSMVVDILANNAGVANEGLSVDTAPSDLENMVNVNAMTYAKLSCLYGQDMKSRKRGRILMVSSMAGLASAAPNTAVYGATKAFGKSLALSMAKELEKYGVGVTCLIPGPVTTEFRHSSPGMAKALCWYLPFYPKPAETVAHLGVMSLLDGDTQVIPGWQNRVFVKIIRPILPQRLETLCVEAAFSPLRFPSLFPFQKARLQGQNIAENEGASTRPSGANVRPRYTMQPPPRLLKLDLDDADIRLDNKEDANDTTLTDHQDDEMHPTEKLNEAAHNQSISMQAGDSREDDDGETACASCALPNSVKEDLEGNFMDAEEEKAPKDADGNVAEKFSMPSNHHGISPLLGPIDFMATEDNEFI